MLLSFELRLARAYGGGGGTVMECDAEKGAEGGVLDSAFPRRYGYKTVPLGRTDYRKRARGSEGPR